MLGLLLLLAELGTAGGTDVFLLEGNDLLVAAAENTCRLMLAENDRLAIDIYLYGISEVDVKSPAELDGEYDTAQLVYFSYDTC